MKKTITSSIGTIVFHIEEDAHDKLAAYIDAIKRSLSDSGGKEEILADIETRIAEILQQKVSDYKQAVTLTDVEDVIAIMGSPEVFGQEAKGGTAGERTGATSNAYYYTGGRKRIFRDPDDKVLFGVCSGISYHFGIEPLWLRLAFGLSILIGGFGIFLYLLLAAVLPKARTAADKLEMKGEPVDVHNIRRFMEEEFEDLKKKVGDFKSSETKERIVRQADGLGKKAGDFFHSVSKGVVTIIAAFIKVIAIFIVVIISIVLCALLIGLLFSLWHGGHIIHINKGGTSVHISTHGFLSILSISGLSEGLLVTGLILFLGIPIIALLVWAGRTMSGHRKRTPWFSWTASVLWAVGMVLLFVVTVMGFSHYSVSASTKEQIDLPNSSRSLTLKLGETGLQNETSIAFDSLNLYINENGDIYGNPVLCMEQSPDSVYHLLLIRSARGISRDEASRNAASIIDAVSFKDSTLTVSPYFNISSGSPWRKQKLQFDLQVPLNKSVILPNNIDRIVCSALHKKYALMDGKQWQMTADGFTPHP